jgi:hypothetical protein
MNGGSSYDQPTGKYVDYDSSSSLSGDFERKLITFSIIKIFKSIENESNQYDLLSLLSNEEKYIMKSIKMISEDFEAFSSTLTSS